MEALKRLDDARAALDELEPPDELLELEEPPPELDELELLELDELLELLEEFELDELLELDGPPPLELDGPPPLELDGPGPPPLEELGNGRELDDGNPVAINASFAEALSVVRPAAARMAAEPAQLRLKPTRPGGRKHFPAVSGHRPALRKTGGASARRLPLVGAS
jgi:hypothetical protein